MMTFIKIAYQDLNKKQREIYNFQKISSVLADYGFNCIKLADDWNGADFLAYHFDGEETLKVQLKGRLTIAKKYLGKNLHMAFPIEGRWCLIEHDELVNLVEVQTNWLETDSWNKLGEYNTASPNSSLKSLIEKNLL